MGFNSAFKGLSGDQSEHTARTLETVYLKAISNWRKLKGTVTGIIFWKNDVPQPLILLAELNSLQ